jgi:[acyl-carrier-protein] S-malonyltransferase
VTQTIFVFPGQGSQSVGMGSDLYREFKEFASVLEQASDILGISFQKLCFEDSQGLLNQTQYTQPALLTISTGIGAILKERAGLSPTCVAGHSLGEYSALVALGVLSFSDALKSVRYRGQVMQQAVPVGVGGMVAYLGSQIPQVRKFCQEVSTQDSLVQIVNFNSPQQCVLSGHMAALEKACAFISEHKLGKALKLPVSAPFHSSLMEPAARQMKEFLNEVPFASVFGQIIPNVEAKLYKASEYKKEMLVAQVVSPVLWTDSLQVLNTQYPDARWIEVGPGAVLQGLIKKTLPQVSCAVTKDVESLKEIL